MRSAFIRRLPLVIFDHGPISLRGRFLSLEHTGRRSGLPRRVLLEVVDRPDADTYLIAASNLKNDWVRNVRRTPAVRLTMGHRIRAHAEAEILGEADVTRALASWACRRPFAWSTIVPVLVARGRRNVEPETVQGLSDLVRLVRLSVHHPTPPSPVSLSHLEDRR